MAWEEGCAFIQPICLAAKLSLQHPGLPVLYMTAGTCLCPAGLLASSLAGSILLCLKVFLPLKAALKGIAPPQSSPGPFPVASGRFRFLPTRWAAPPQTAARLTTLPCSCHLGPQVPSATLFQTAGGRSQGKGKKKSFRPRIERPEAPSLGQPVAHLLSGICISSASL